MSEKELPAAIEEMLGQVGEDHPYWDRDALVAFYENDSWTWDKNPDAGEFAEAFEDAYAGTYESLKEYAEELAEETVEDTDRLNVWPYTCIDWDDAGRELEMGGDVWTHESGYRTVHIFRNV